MKELQWLRNGLLIAGVLLGFARCGFAQTFNNGPGNTVKICGTPKYPASGDGCYSFDKSAPYPGNGPSTIIAQFTANQMQMMLMAQISDLKDQIVTLTQAVKDLKQSNADAAKATGDAAAAIQKENSDFNTKFSAAIADKLANYPADFVSSPAYQKLEKELTDMINERLPTAHAPAGAQLAAPAVSATQSASNSVQQPQNSSVAETSRTPSPATTDQRAKIGGAQGRPANPEVAATLP